LRDVETPRNSDPAAGVRHFPRDRSPEEAQSMAAFISFRTGWPLR